MKADDNRTYDKDGNVISKRTGKPPQKKGFALNKNNINKGGRPKGARNKSTLIKAQLKIDNLSDCAVELLEAVVKADAEKLGLKTPADVPLKLRIDSAKELLNKAIANEKSKPGEDSNNSSEEEDTGTIFSLTPVKSNQG